MQNDLSTNLIHSDAVETETRRPCREKICGTCRFLASEGEDGGVTVEMVEDEVGRRQVRVRYVDWSSPVTQACLVCLDLYLDFLHPRHKQNQTTPPAYV